MDAAPLPRRCPFCGTEAIQARCTSCHRDPTAARRTCSGCRKLTPVAEPLCMHCRHGRTSDLDWKIPVIILLFVVAIAAAVALQSVR